MMWRRSMARYLWSVIRGAVVMSGTFLPGLWNVICSRAQVPNKD